MLTDKLKQNEAIVCVAGLGYVGLPLAIEFSKSLKVSPILVDVRGIFEEEEAIEKGFYYRCL